MMYGQPVQANTSPAISAPRDWELGAIVITRGVVILSPDGGSFLATSDALEIVRTGLHPTCGVAEMRAIHELTGQTGMIQRLAQVPTGCPRSALAPRRPDRIGAENMHGNYCDVSLKLQQIRGPYSIAAGAAAYEERVKLNHQRVRGSGSRGCGRRSVRLGRLRQGGAMGRRARRWPPATRVRGPER
jgi:hypothetical protein